MYLVCRIERNYYNVEYRKGRGRPKKCVFIQGRYGKRVGGTHYPNIYNNFFLTPFYKGYPYGY